MVINFKLSTSAKRGHNLQNMKLMNNRGGHTVQYSARGLLLINLLVRSFDTISFWVYIDENRYLIQSARNQP